MTGQPYCPPLAGLEVRVDRCLAGSKVSFQFGDGPVYVSPAMWELMRNADEKELRLLMETIHVRRLPPLPRLDSLGMTTIPPANW